MGYLVTILLIAALVFAAKYFLLKKSIVSITRQLEDSCCLVTTSLADHNLNELVQNINELLEKMQQMLIQKNHSTAALKSSIANISHDMKTPLTSVIGYLQLAEKECRDEATKDMIKICLERTVYCNALINDFFELSLVESQGITPNMEAVDVAQELCEQILANVPLFEEKGITPHFENSGKSVVALADFMMYRRIVQNLISNSIKYTSGDIFFDVSDGETVVVTVANPVAEPVDTEHIFDKFYMQDKSRHGGYGIGLYLCREFAEMMGGGICAEMEGEMVKIRVKLGKFEKGGL